MQELPLANQKEETYQVTLDALKISPCYLAFLITAEVPEVYMHQFWNTIQKIKDIDAYRFKLDKKKFRVDTEELGYSGKYDMLSAIHTDQMHQPWRTFVAIINRCISGKTTRLDRLRESQDFMYQADNREISSARKEKMPYPRFIKVIINHFISKDKTISMRNRINLHTIHDDSLLDIKDSKAYKTYYDFATGKATPKKARKYKKVVSPFQKLSPVLEEEPAEKPKRARKPAKKSTTIPTACVVIRDTPRESVPNKKTPAKVDRGKGMNLLSDAALVEAAQESHMLHPSGLGDGFSSQPKVLDESEDKITCRHEGTQGNDDDSIKVTKDDDEDDVESDANEDKEASDSEKTNFDEDENLNVNKNDDEEEDHEEECKGEKERKGDTEMTDADKSISQEISYEQVVDDAYVTLTTTQKTEGSMQSSSVSSDFASKFLNLDNVPPADNEVVSMMNVKTFYSIPHITTPTPVPTTELTTSSIPALPDFASLFEFDQRVTRTGFATQTALQSYTSEFKKKAQAEKEKYIDIIGKSVKEIIKDEVKSKQHRDLYDALVKSYQLDKDLFDFYGKAYSLKRGHEDKDKDEDHPAGSDQGLKKRKTSKDVEPPKGSKSKETKSSSSKGTKSQPKTSSKSVQAEKPVFETADTEMPQD
nr:hypothetical protein [Tanacetum cinerariifolium]